MITIEINHIEINHKTCSIKAMKRETIRRLNYLCDKNHKPHPEFFKNPFPIQNQEVHEAMRIFSENGFSPSEAEDYWQEIRSKKWFRSITYSQKPIPVRKDNKDFINYSRSRSSYCSNGNKIRYPRKVRKTAWKRFYKLFPHLMPK